MRWCGYTSRTCIPPWSGPSRSCTASSASRFSREKPSSCAPICPPQWHSCPAAPKFATAGIVVGRSRNPPAQSGSPTTPKTSGKRSPTLAFDTVSAVGVAPIADAVDGDGVVRLIEEYAVVADAQPQQPFKLSAERLDSTGAGCGVTMDGRQNIQGGTLLDSTNLLRNTRVEADFLHRNSYLP